MAQDSFHLLGKEHMPYLPLYTKKVAVNDDTKIITVILEEALEKQDIKREIVPKENVATKGWWYGIVLKALETATDKKLGSECLMLRSDRIELDEFVYRLVIDFRSFL